MLLRKPSNFKLQELVDPWTFEKYGQKAWRFLDFMAVEILQAMRDRYGPARVNDWLWGGNRKYAGFRPPQCRIGAKLSMHRLGKAFDPIFKYESAEEVRKDLRAQIKEGVEPFIHLGGIERDVSWNHIDTRSTLTGKPLWFKP